MEGNVFSLFSTLFSIFSKAEIFVCAALNLSLSNAINLDMSRTLKSCNELNKTDGLAYKMTKILLLKPFPNKPLFLHVFRKSLLKTL